MAAIRPRTREGENWIALDAGAVNGENVSVAVIDTAVDETHPALAGRRVGQERDLTAVRCHVLDPTGPVERVVRSRCQTPGNPNRSGWGLFDPD